MTTAEAPLFYRKITAKFTNSSRSLLSQAHSKARDEVNHRLDEIIERMGCRPPPKSLDALAQEAVETKSERSEQRREFPGA